MEQITSRHNPLMAYIRKLNASASFRREEGVFVGEGPKLLEEALRWRAEIPCLICAQGLESAAGSGQAQIRRQVAVPADLLSYLSDTRSPQGVIFLCRMPELRPPETLTPGRYLVLDGVQDPGNVGTIWRTADALGADGLFLLEGCADPFAPKTVRATMGACFRLRAWQIGLDALRPRLEHCGIPLYAAALEGENRDVREVDWRHSAAVIGSEGRGVSRTVLEACQSTVRIPMRERCESLNAAVAAAVILWEGARQADVLCEARGRER